jgi:hypothetical protein
MSLYHGRCYYEFSGLPHDALRQLARWFDYAEHPKGETLFREKDLKGFNHELESPNAPNNIPKSHLSPHLNTSTANASINDNNNSSEGAGGGEGGETSGEVKCAPPTQPSATSVNPAEETRKAREARSAVKTVKTVKTVTVVTENAKPIKPLLRIILGGSVSVLINAFGINCHVYELQQGESFDVGALIAMSAGHKDRSAFAM